MVIGLVLSRLAAGIREPVTSIFSTFSTAPATAGAGVCANDCAAILEQTELMHRANMLAGGLPLLDRKRLELARALATGPRILLLDEIAGGLTEGECQSLVATIRSIHARGITIVWIEHVLHALTSVVERLVVLDFGRLIAAGKPDEVMAMQSVKEIYLGVDV